MDAVHRDVKPSNILLRRDGRAVHVLNQSPVDPAAEAFFEQAFGSLAGFLAVFGL